MYVEHDMLRVYALCIACRRLGYVIGWIILAATVLATLDLMPLYSFVNIYCMRLFYISTPFN